MIVAVVGLKLWLSVGTSQAYCLHYTHVGLPQRIIIMHVYAMLCLKPENELSDSLHERISFLLGSFGWMNDPLNELVWRKTPKDSIDSDPERLRLTLEQTLENALRDSATSNVIHYTVQAGDLPPINGTVGSPGKPNQLTNQQCTAQHSVLAKCRMP
ncbi:hypothetical protein EMIT0194P_110108 [Pseudomonas serbica]